MPMTRVFTILLALLIAVTSQQMAVARGTMLDAAGQVVLCTGHGVQTVTIDHHGDPMETVHICPDCAMTIAVSFDAPVAVQTAVVHVQTLGQTPVCDLQMALVPNAALARGPPVSI